MNSHISVVSLSHRDLMPREPVWTTRYSELVSIHAPYIVNSPWLLLFLLLSKKQVSRLQDSRYYYYILSEGGCVTSMV